MKKCRSYIDCQLLAQSQPAPKSRRLQSSPAIALSRQTGSGARSIAAALADFLEKNGPSGKCPWTVFDRSLVEKAMEEHNLPKELARFLPEDRRSYIDEIMEELVGLHPPSWTLIRQTTETILNLAEMGRVILIGRGANVITARLPGVFHVRLVGSLEKRRERVMAYYELDRKAAGQFIRKEDRGRARYLEKHFHVDIADELFYHLVVNTDRIDGADAVQLIGEAALRHFRRTAG